MSPFRLPMDLLEIILDYNDDPVSYSRLRGSCRDGASSLSCQLLVSLDTLGMTRLRYPGSLDMDVDQRFWITDPLSDRSASCIIPEPHYRIAAFFERFSVDEFRSNLSQSVLRKCLDVSARCCLRNLCVMLMEACDDPQYLANMFLFKQLVLGRTDIVDLVVPRWASLTRNDSRGSLLVELTRNEWDVRMFNFLLDRGVPLEEINLLTYLETFDNDCNPKVMDIVLRQHKDRDLVKSSTAFTRRAAINGSIVFVKLLMKHGAPINSNECVAHTMDFRMIQFLVNECHADVNYVDPDGRSAMWTLCHMSGMLTKIRPLIALGATLSPEHAFQTMHTALQGSARPAATISRLMKDGIDINTIDRPSGYNILHIAMSYAEFYGEYTIPYLIRSGVNVNLKDAHGVTPLMLAAANCTPWTVSLLIAEGAIVDDVDNRGRSPLEYSTWNPDPEVEAVVRSHALPHPAPERKRRRRGQRS